MSLNQVSFYPLQSDESFVGPDGRPVTGFGQTMYTSATVGDVELEQNFESTLNIVIIFVTVLLFLILLVNFWQVETASESNAVPLDID